MSITMSDALENSVILFLWVTYKKQLSSTEGIINNGYSFVFSVALLMSQTAIFDSNTLNQVPERENISQ